MDSFRVRAKDTSVLKRSHLVEELQSGADEMEMFPVLIGGQIGYFHDVDGGFSQSSNTAENNYHIVNLIHRVQGPDSPPNKIYSDTMEAHLADGFYQLDVADVTKLTQVASGLSEEQEYPDGDFVLSLKVTDYQMGPYSFSEAMSADIDKREQEFPHNGADE
jgi:hypothetical protein